MNLRKIIKEVIKEAAVEVDELHNTLLVTEFLPSECKIVLLDSNLKDIIGFLYAKRLNGSDCFSVKEVVAEKGYGPLLYEFAMMAVHPCGICPDNSGESTDKAVGVWKKFIERNDVEKLPIPKLAMSVIRNVDTNRIMFLKTPTTSFENMTHKADEFIRSMEMNEEQFKRDLFNRCASKFSNAYRNR